MTDETGPLPIWEVRMESHTEATVFIQAETMAEAEEAAVEVVREVDWVEQYVDTDSRILDAPPPRRYWSGGPDGDWVQP